jgi:hypothetical protein
MALCYELANVDQSADKVLELSYLENFVDSRDFINDNSSKRKVSTHFSSVNSYIGVHEIT